MYSKREKEAVLAQFHASGLRVRTACRELPGFPCDETLRKWLEEEARGLLDPPELRQRGSARGRARHRRYPEATRREAARLVRAGVSRRSPPAGSACPPDASSRAGRARRAVCFPARTGARGRSGAWEGRRRGRPPEAGSGPSGATGRRTCPRTRGSASRPWSASASRWARCWTS